MATTTDVTTPSAIPFDLSTRLLSWLRQSARFLIPADCIACGVALGSDPIPFFCRTCWSTITPLSRPSCARCDHPFASDAATSHTPGHLCHHCLERLPAFERAWTPYPYIPPLQEAICAFKYRRKVGLARPLARLMIQALPSSLAADLLMPVPLHPSRLRAREFNQSLLLADQVGRHLGLPVAANTLVRLFATDPQTTLSRPERLRNLRQAFAVRTQDAIAGRRILLIDDVYTTGTTLNECAKVLIKSGAKTVLALTLARTVETSLIPDRVATAQAERALAPMGF